MKTYEIFVITRIENLALLFRFIISILIIPILSLANSGSQDSLNRDKQAIDVIRGMMSNGSVGYAVASDAQGRDIAAYPNGYREVVDPQALDRFSEAPTKTNWEALTVDQRLSVMTDTLAARGPSDPKAAEDFYRWGRQYLANFNEKNEQIYMYKKAWSILLVDDLTEDLVDGFYAPRIEAMKDIFSKMQNLNPKQSEMYLCELAFESNRQVNNSGDSFTDEYSLRTRGNAFMLAEQLAKSVLVNRREVECEVRDDWRGQVKTGNLRSLLIQAKHLNESWVKEFNDKKAKFQANKTTNPSRPEGASPMALTCSKDQLKKVSEAWDNVKNNQSESSWFGLSEPGCSFTGTLKKGANGKIIFQLFGYFDPSLKKPQPFKDWDEFTNFLGPKKQPTQSPGLGTRPVAPPSAK